MVRAASTYDEQHTWDHDSLRTCTPKTHHHHNRGQGLDTTSEIVYALDYSKCCCAMVFRRITSLPCTSCLTSDSDADTSAETGHVSDKSSNARNKIENRAAPPHVGARRCAYITRRIEEQSPAALPATAFPRSPPVMRTGRRTPPREGVTLSRSLWGSAVADSAGW